MGGARRGDRRHRRRNRARGRRLIERFLEWIAGLPPQAIYAVIGLLAALENVVPPVPADTAVALGAFVAAQDVPISPIGVYLVTVAGNVASAVGVFIAARRFGRPFFATRLGRRLISEQAMAGIEASYQRHHLWGIFASRFLPVYRAVVPPFAGIAGLKAYRALPPMVLASAIYYGILVISVHTVAANWDDVQRVLGRIGAVLALLALAVTAALGYALWRRRRPTLP